MARPRKSITGYTPKGNTEATKLSVEPIDNKEDFIYTFNQHQKYLGRRPTTQEMRNTYTLDESFGGLPQIVANINRPGRRAEVKAPAVIEEAVVPKPSPKKRRTKRNPEDVQSLRFSFARTQQTLQTRPTRDNVMTMYGVPEGLERSVAAYLANWPESNRRNGDTTSYDEKETAAIAAIGKKFGVPAMAKYFGLQVDELSQLVEQGKGDRIEVEYRFERDLNSGALNHHFFARPVNGDRGLNLKARLLSAFGKPKGNGLTGIVDDENLEEQNILHL